MNGISQQPKTLDLPVGVAIEVGAEDAKTVCKLCFRPSFNGDLKLGPLYEYIVDPVSEVYCAHLFCLIFSAGLTQKGEDDEGIKGFLPEDILKEWRRGQRLKCIFCEKRYATLGCVAKTCRRTYHLPCAIQNGVLLEFIDNFNTYCREHRPFQTVTFQKDDEKLCGVCLENLEVNFKEGIKTLWAPCCGSWVHRSCIDLYAESAGYFFKCPLCNDDEIFPKEMKKFGVYIPEQDASWERVPNAFEELLERHGRCDVEKCLCPEGREKDEDYTEWEVILCRCCGSQGVHVTCGGLKVEGNPQWCCSFCKAVEKKLPSHQFSKVSNNFKQKKSRRERQKVKRFVESFSFRLNSDLSITAIRQNRLNPVSVISVPICPSYSVPYAVQIDRSKFQKPLPPTTAIVVEREEKPQTSKEVGETIVDSIIEPISASDDNDEPNFDYKKGKSHSIGDKSLKDLNRKDLKSKDKRKKTTALKNIKNILKKVEKHQDLNNTAKPSTVTRDHKRKKLKILRGQTSILNFFQKQK